MREHLLLPRQSLNNIGLLPPPRGARPALTFPVKFSTPTHVTMCCGPPHVDWYTRMGRFSTRDAINNSGSPARGGGGVGGWLGGGGGGGAGVGTIEEQR